MRPVSSSPAAYPTTSASSDAKTPAPTGESEPYVPPRELNIYLPEDETGEALTREKYVALCEAGKIQPDAYLDFLYCGITPSPDYETDAFMALVARLRESGEFNALEFLLNRSTELESLVVCDHEGLTENNAREFADVLRRVRPKIASLHILNEQPLTQLQAVGKLKAITAACPHLRELSLLLVDEDDVNALAGILGSLENLGTFKVCSLDLTSEEHRAAYCRKLILSSGVKGLDLSALVASDETKSALLRALAEPEVANRLRSLKLNIDDFRQPEQQELLVKLIGRLSSLEVLDLGRAAESLEELPAICKAISACPSPLKAICLRIDAYFSHWGLDVLEALADTARRRPGLQDIEGFDTEKLWYDGFKEKAKILEDLKVAPPDSVEWKHKSKLLASHTLSVLLRRNRAFAREGFSEQHASAVAQPGPPVGQNNLDNDTGSVLTRQILAHSDSVSQFQITMNEVALAVAAINGLMDEPTSTAASSSTTTSSISSTSDS